MNLPMYVYRTAMTENNFGMANAAGVTLILLGCVTVMIINRIFSVGGRTGEQKALETNG